MTTYPEPKRPGTPTWVDVAAPDAEAARAFYHEVFGWDYDIAGPEYGGYATARLGTRPVAGITAPMPGAPPAPVAWTLYFASDNAEADQARAAGLGATVLFPAMKVGEMGSMAMLMDPTGATFGFWQAGRHIGAQVTDEPGAMTWHELYATDAKRARDFYTALLGATAEPMPGGMEYYVLKHGEKQLCGIMQIDPAWGNMQPMWTTYFAVADADKTVAVVTGHGGMAMGNIDDSPFGRIAALRDPAGAVFKVVQPPTQ